mmetsp:Transcript_16730/g.36368  ORF Transcript_16730/g.36368 Transcript_16730/m.36368 type:complete len:203 (+) Transcript_16730:596-1204(+)
MSLPTNPWLALGLWSQSPTRRDPAPAAGRFCSPTWRRPFHRRPTCCHVRPGRLARQWWSGQACRVAGHGLVVRADRSPAAVAGALRTVGCFGPAQWPLRQDSALACMATSLVIHGAPLTVYVDSLHSQEGSSDENQNRVSGIASRIRTMWTDQRHRCARRAPSDDAASARSHGSGAPHAQHLGRGGLFTRKLRQNAPEVRVR